MFTLITMSLMLAFCTTLGYLGSYSFAGSGVRPQVKTASLICVIGNSFSLREAVTRLFQPKKYQVESFPTVESFLNRKAHHGPCSLVLELQGPDLSGLNLQLILSKNRRTEQIIFISSGFCDIPMCAHAFKGGAVDFLTKPLKEDELFQAVQEGLLRSAQLIRLNEERQAAQTLLNSLTPREQKSWVM